MTPILVTGGAGFIGSNFIPYFLEENQDYFLINLDLLTYAGDLANLAELTRHQRYEFVKGDIRDMALLNSLFDQYNIEHVIHFAAESHVDNSIVGPKAFIETNINGTFALLEAARAHWLTEPFKAKDGFENSRFHHISTDEVYGSLGDTGFFTEDTPYAPNSPYSASKASSDMLVRSYTHTYGLNTTITNCSNNYGPKQHDEKLIPTIIRSAINHQPIPVYGTGENVRDWLYVTDHCTSINVVFHKGQKGSTYNIGGDNEIKNIDVVKTICSKLDQITPWDGHSYHELITFVKDRAGHDWRYAIDASKVKNELGWNPTETFETGLSKTIHWYLDKYLK